MMPSMPLPQNPAQKQNPEIEAKLVAMVKQAKQIAEESGVDFTLVMEKALGGMPNQQLPPPPSNL